MTIWPVVAPGRGVHSNSGHQVEQPPCRMTLGPSGENASTSHSSGYRPGIITCSTRPIGARPSSVRPDPIATVEDRYRFPSSPTACPGRCDSAVFRSRARSTAR